MFFLDVLCVRLKIIKLNVVGSSLQTHEVVKVVAVNTAASS